MLKHLLEIIGAFIVGTVFIVIPIVVVFSRAKNRNDFTAKARSLEKGRLMKLCQLWNSADSINPPVYKWEKKYWAGHYITKTLYVSVVIQDDVIIAIDKNF